MPSKSPIIYSVFIALFFLAFVSCSKNKPRRGLYWSEFYTTDSLGAETVKYDHSVTIEDVSESALTINGATLEKNGKSIKGPMGYTPAFPASVTILLDGKWKNKNGYYTISGAFSAVGVNESYFGSFQMGSY